MSEWISINDIHNRPEPDSPILVSNMEDVFMGLLTIRDGIDVWCCDEYGEHWDITHWMPLPEPPK